MKYVVALTPVNKAIAETYQNRPIAPSIRNREARHGH
jgi:hypothetical protein